MQIKKGATRRFPVLLFFLLALHGNWNSGWLLPAPAYAETSDVTTSTKINLGTLFFDSQKLQSYTPASIRNTSSQPLVTPLQFIISSTSTPDVTVSEPDGYTAEGQPYFFFRAFNGDMDGNGICNAEDIRTISSAFGITILPGKAPCTTDVPCQADIDGDKDVDGADLTLFDSHCGKTYSALTGGDMSETRIIRFNNPKKSRFSFTKKILVESAPLPPVNDPPVFTSTPGTTAEELQTYLYHASASDPEQTDLIFKLIQGPSGMNVNATSGDVSWTPESGQAGDHFVSLQVEDGQGGSAHQDFTVSVAAAHDLTSPVVRLGIPAQAQAGSIIQLSAECTDNIHVSEVSLFIDGLLAQQFAQPPYTFAYNTPETVGQLLKVRVAAADSAGNLGSAESSILIVATPDTTPPLIGAIAMPQSAAPGETITVRAEANDDRGIAEVRFRLGNGETKNVLTPPFETHLSVPADAVAGQELSLLVAALDGSGNQVEASRQLTVQAAADTTPPEAVTLSGPTQSLPGQSLTFSATAVDQGGILKVIFLVNGQPAGEDSEAPFQFSYTLAADSTPGSQVNFQSRAYDFAGNVADSAPLTTFILAPGQGIISGEVYDDTNGQPVGNALVRLVVAQGKTLASPLMSLTDNRGRYDFLTAEGHAVIEIGKEGFSSITRAVTVEPNSIATPLDARLTPLGLYTATNNLTGGNISIDENRASLYLPPGAFSGSTLVSLRTLSLQALPSVLPLGWSPASAVRVDADAFAQYAALELTLRGLPNTGQLIAVRYDEASRQWVRLETNASASGDGLVVALSTLGTVAMVRPDTLPQAPAVPEIGQPLSGVTALPIPAGVTARILPTPEIIFMQPGTKSEVRAVLENAPSLPSGTGVQVDFSESYERTDQSFLRPEGMTQDFILYQGENGFESHFVASPSEIFDPIKLQEGVIRLEAYRPSGQDGSGLVGPAGGAVSSPEGFAVTIPAGSLTEESPVQVKKLPADPALTGSATFTWLSEFELNLGGSTLGTSATLALSPPQGMTADDQVLLVRAVRVGNTTRHELAGIAHVNGSELSVSSGGLGLPLKGITGEGRYSLLKMNQPVGFATGTVQSVLSGLTDSAALPLVSLVDAAHPLYVLALPLGNSTISGTDLTNGGSGTAAVEVAAKDNIVLQDLNLTASRPLITSITPADEATGVSMNTAITVRFSRPMDATLVNSDTFTVHDGISRVQGTASLLADQVTAVFRPSGLLAENRRHHVMLDATIRDSFGNLLFGNQQDGAFTSSFTTPDITPPARPTPGQVSISMPEVNGLVHVLGTLGTVEPDTAVTVINQSTGATSTVIAKADGSFDLTISADIWHQVELVLADQAGNKTTFSPGVFSNGNGVAAVGPAGGTMTLSDGSTFTFAPGSFERAAKVTIQTIAEAQVPVPTPGDFGMEYAAGFTIDTGGQELKEPLKFRIPTQGNFTENTQFIVSRLDEVMGEKRPVVSEAARFEDGFIIVNSPPWPGIMGMMSISTWVVYAFSDRLPHTFVMGDVHKAPPIGVLTIEVEKAISPMGTAHVVARATPIISNVTITNWKMEESTCLPTPGSWTTLTPTMEDNNTVAKYETVLDPSSASQVVSIIAYYSLGQRSKTWRVEATFTTAAGEEFVAKAEVSTLLVINPDFDGEASLEKNTGTHHIYKWRGLESTGNPYVGAWVEVYNGVNSGFPTVTQTNKLGKFVLAVPPGPNYIRVFDPVTGHGTKIPFDAPSTFGDFVSIPKIVVPEAVGDGIPPTLDVQVTGSLVRTEPFTVKVSTTDDKDLALVQAFILGFKVADWTASGTSYSNTFTHTTFFDGDLEIETVAVDKAGNRTTRKTMVRIKDIVLGPNATSKEGTITMEPNSTNVITGTEVDIKLRTQIADGISLSDLTGIGAYFIDSLGNRIDAYGGTAGGGGWVHVRPASPLPPGTKLKLVVDTGSSTSTGGCPGGATCIDFTTKGMDIGGKLGGFGEIRGIAIYGNFIYVADFQKDKVMIVDISDPKNPTLATSFPFAGPRGLAVESNSLVVIGGGGTEGTLPLLRLYDLNDPLAPTRVGSVILFPLIDQALPINVRIKPGGALAYVSTVGIGVQSVDLNIIRDISLIPPSTLPDSIKMGQPALVGGLRLPDETANPPLPPLTAAAYDTAMLPGLVLTGGAQAQLFVLSGTTGGYLSIVPQVDASGGYSSPFINLPYGVQRVASSPDFLIRKDLDNDGKTDLYQNINLGVVSHGTNGISFVDVSNPARGTVLSSLNTNSRVFDMDIIDGWVFTGDKVVTMYDPTQAIASDPLKYKLPDNSDYTFSSGGDLDVAVTYSPLDGRRYSFLASSDAGRNTLQLGLMETPAPGPDWDIIRTTAFEPWTNPDNDDYFHTGDPVNPFTGEFTQDETDMTVPGRGLHFSFSRSYRSQNEFNGPMGYGWDFNYNSRLTVLPDATDPTQTGDIIWYDGGGKAARFKKAAATGAASVSYTPPDGIFAELKDGSDALSTFFELTDSSGVKTTFRPMNQQGQIHYTMVSMEDRLKNIIRFKYNSRGQLEKVRDTLGRDYRFSYDLRGRMIALTDFAERQILYRYDFADNLISVTTPPVTGFPDGKTTHYVYDSSHPAFDVQGAPLPVRLLNHNLLRIVDPEGNTYLENEYGAVPNMNDFDRVTVQHFGKPGDEGAGDYQFVYTVTTDQMTPVTPSNTTSIQISRVTSVTTTNRRGDKTIRNYDTNGHLQDVTEDAVVSGNSAQVTSRYEYFQPSGLMKKATTPRGLMTEYTYDSINTKQIRQADLLTVKVTPAGGGTPRTITYTRGAWGVITQITDPQGRVTNYTLDNNGKGLVEKITSSTVTQSDGTTQTVINSFTYGTFGELLSATDATGVVTQYDYFSASDPNGDNDDSETLDARSDNELETNGKGLLKQVTQDSSQGGSSVMMGGAGGSGNAKLNLKTAFTYDAVGNILTVTDPRGLVTTHTVNDLNQTTKVTDGRGSRSYFFDGNDNLKQVDDLSSRKVELHYNSLNLLTTKTESAPGSSGGRISRTTTYGYDQNENPDQVTSAEGYEVSTSFEPRGLLTQMSTGGSGANAVSGVIKRTFYDMDGLLVREEDAEGHDTIHTYDGFHQRIRRTDPNGHDVRFEYDDNGRLIAARNFDPSGAIAGETKWELDEIGRTRVLRRTIIGGLGSGGTNPTEETRYVYDAEGRVLKVTDPMSRVATMTYDALGRVLTQTDALGNKKTMTYTGLDLTKVTLSGVEPGGTTSTRSTDYKYDTYGRLTEEKIGAGTPQERKRTITYDTNNLPTQESIAGGTTTTRTYDGFLRLTNVTTGAESTDIGYDNDNRVTSQSDAQGRTLSSTYDGRNRLLSIQYPDASSRTFSYYQDDLLQRVVDRAGNAIRYTYDDGNRLRNMAVTYAQGFEGITSQSYTYDGLNRITTTSVGSAVGANTIGYTYNARGDVLAETQGANTIHRNYDLGGSLTAVQYPQVSLNFGRDGLGRLASVTSGSATLAQYQYGGVSRLTKATYGNGVFASAGFNAVYERVSKSYATAAQTLTGFNLTYDQAGRIEQIAKTHLGGQTEDFSYSEEGWLASTQGPAGKVSYTYDASGNRASVERDGIAETYTTNTLNQYLSAGPVALIYDGNGNVSQDDRFRYTYDVFGRLVRVENAAGGPALAVYEYDAAGRRIGRTTNAGPETLAYDGTQLITVSDAGGTVLRRYLYGAGTRVPFALQRGSDLYYFQYDVNGSVAAIADASGQIVERYEFDMDGAIRIFDGNGNVRAASAVDNDFGYAGSLVEPITGLMHMGARDYLPRIGRFLQPDPAGSLDGLNPYVYAGNDPVNFIDPTGLFRQASADNVNIRSFSGVSLLQGGQVAEMMLASPHLVRNFPAMAKGIAGGAVKAARFAKVAVPRAARIAAFGPFYAASMFGDIAKTIINNPGKGFSQVAKRLEIMVKQQGANWKVAGQELDAARAIVRREVELGQTPGNQFHTGGKFGLGEGVGAQHLSGYKRLEFRMNRTWDNVRDTLSGESHFEKPFVQAKITESHGYERVLRKDIDVITDAEWAKPGNPHAEPFRYEIAHAGNQGAGMHLFDDVYQDHGIMPPTFKNAQGVGKDLESLDLYREGNWIFKELKSSRADGMVWVDPREVISIPANLF